MQKNLKARQDYRTMAEDWQVDQVKAEIQADPRWDAWAASTKL